MKRSLTIFLQVIIGLIAVGALTFLLWMPQIEGRNVDATFIEIYFKDPFLAFAYVASVAFFLALYKSFKVLNYIRQNRTFTEESVSALRTIKYCAIAVIGFVVVGVIWIMLQGSDDRAGGVFMGILITFGSVVIATAAALFEKILQEAVAIKS